MILPERVFGRPGANWIRSGAAIGPISLRTHADQLLAQVLGRLLAGHQRHVGVDALALDVVRIADDRGLRHLRVRDQRALDLGRAHAVAGDVDHVVDAAGDPVIAVLVAAAAVAGEVLARIGLEVGVDEALVVAIDGAHLPRPAVRDAQIAGRRALQHLAVGVDDLRARRRRTASVAEPGFCAIAPGSGVIRMPPVSVCHQVSTIGQRLSPTTR